MNARGRLIYLTDSSYLSLFLQELDMNTRTPVINLTDSVRSQFLR